MSGPRRSLRQRQTKGFGSNCRVARGESCQGVVAATLVVVSEGNDRGGEGTLLRYSSWRTVGGCFLPRSFRTGRRHAREH